MANSSTLKRLNESGKLIGDHESFNQMACVRKWKGWDFDLVQVSLNSRTLSIQLHDGYNTKLENLKLFQEFVLSPSTHPFSFYSNFNQRK